MSAFGSSFVFKRRLRHVRYHANSGAKPDVFALRNFEPMSEAASAYRLCFRKMPLTI